MKRTKYDGKLTDALIQTVIEAENRVNGLVVPQPEASMTPQIDQQAPLNMPVGHFSRRLDLPTAAERREAWIREHGPDAGESDE